MPRMIYLAGEVKIEQGTETMDRIDYDGCVPLPDGQNDHRPGGVLDRIVFHLQWIQKHQECCVHVAN